jgi:signal transduction histidine kinase
VSLPWVVVQSAVLVFINRGFSNAMAITTAFFAFQLFGLFAVRIAHTEGQMRCALAEANTELRVATGLLEINSRAEERLRISRDLHDLIGHHLTALTLNLEVASHLADGQAREHIEKSKSLAKLLLSDVRDVVGRLRENEVVDVTAAIQSLRDVIGRPVLHIDLDRIAAMSVPISAAALRVVQEIVTNAVRHSEASNLWLKLAISDQSLTIEARDDGVGTDDIRFGNGLRGMHERIEELHGTMEVRSGRGRGFDVLVRLPLSGAPA